MIKCLLQRLYFFIFKPDMSGHEYIQETVTMYKDTHIKHMDVLKCANCGHIADTPLSVRIEWL